MSRLVARVTREDCTRGLTLGTIIAAAMAGSLCVFGHRLGSIALPFNAIASLALGPGATAIDWFAPATTLLGVVLLVAVGGALGLLFSLDPTRGTHTPAGPWLWSLTLAAGAFVVTLVLARLFGVGPAVVLPLGDQVVLAAVVTLALPLGMRFAFPESRRSR